MDLPIEIQKRLNALAQKYAPLFQAAVNHELDKLRATGALQQSVTISVTPSTSRSTPQIEMNYAPHGDYVGKRKLLFTKIIPADSLEAWMAARNFTPANIPGYKNGEAPNLTAEQKRSRVSWAIGIEKRANDTWKPNRWKKRALSKTLKELNKDLIAAYQSEIEKILASEISNIITK